MCALALLLMLTYPGGTFDPAWTNAPSASRVYPVGSASVYRLVQPDGGASLFRGVDAAKGVLVGDRPWVGTRQMGRIDVWTDPALTGGKVKAGLTFANGLLRHLEIDGVAYDFPKGSPFPADSLGALFPAKKARSFAKGSAADIWRADASRVRLWFANPNCAGVLFAQLALVALAILVVPGLRRRCLEATHGRRLLAVGTAACATLAAGAVYGLLRTGSRGALAGFAVGCVCLLLPSLRKLLTRRGLLAGAAGILVFGLAVALSGQGARLAGTFRAVDAGNALRIKVARASAAMLSDAPFGWRGGEVPARNACLNWYVLDENHIIRTHLVTLAELGWLGGFAYLLFWTLLLGVGCRALRHRNPVPLAVVAAFFLSGFLNPVFRDWELWAIPCGALAAGLAAGGRWRCREAVALVGGAAGVSALAMVALVGWGARLPRPTSVPVKAVGAAAVVGGAPGTIPAVWVVEDTAALGGFGFPGREILSVVRHRPNAPALAYVHDVKDLPATVETLILPGRAAVDYLRQMRADGTPPCAAKRIVFLSPSVGPQEVPDALLAQADVRWHVGSLAVLRAVESYRVRRPWVRVHAGCELYIPGWLDFADEFAVTSTRKKGEQQ